MHLKPTAGCQISTLIIEKIIVEEDLYEYPMVHRIFIETPYP
jgi:hypothetical protein